MMKTHPLLPNTRTHTPPHPPVRPSTRPPAHTAEAVCTTTVPAEINPLFEVELNSRATCNEGCWRRRRQHSQSQPRCRNIWLLIYARKEPPPHRRVRRRWRDRSHCTDATLERTTRQKKRHAGPSAWRRGVTGEGRSGVGRRLTTRLWAWESRRSRTPARPSGLPRKCTRCRPR